MDVSMLMAVTVVHLVNTVVYSHCEYFRIFWWSIYAAGMHFL